MSFFISKSFRAMGTVNTITIFEEGREEILEQAAARVMELHDRLTVFDPGSQISRINANAGISAVQVSHDTFRLLQEAVRFSRETEGAFSVTIRPLTALWHIGVSSGVLPEAEKIAAARKLVNDKDLIFSENSREVMLRYRGQGLDLGGIAKGYAADEVKRILTEGGIQDAIINLGGSVIILGQPREIGIQHPRRETGVSMGSLVTSGEAVVTSGDYERCFFKEGRRYSHILDSRTGMPAVSGLCQATLAGPSAMTADALTTAIFVLGAEKGSSLAQKYGYELLLVTEQLNLYCSEGMRSRFRLQNPAQTAN